MTEHQFLSNSFFDSLSTTNPNNDLVDARDLIIVSQNAQNENKKFLIKQKNLMVILGVLMILMGILSIFLYDLSLPIIIIGLAISVPVLLHALNHQPDKTIRKKLKKFQGSLSQGLRKPSIKKLAKSKNDRMIFGVFGGFGQYLGIPSIILRVIATALLFFSGGMVLIFYIFFASALPEEESLPELED